MAECSFTDLVIVGLNPVAVTCTSDVAPVSRRKLLNIQGTAQCRFTLKWVCDMIRTRIQFNEGVI